MRKYQIQIALFAVLAVFTITSCQKDGSEGPAGPAGAAGPQGVPGVANVIYSDWLDVVFEAQKNGNGDTVAYTANILAPKLVDSILSKGEVKVFLNAGTVAEPAVISLPFNDLYAITGIQNMNLIFEKGNIFIYSTEDGSTFTTDEGPKAFQYRYVLIPGGVLAVKPNDVRLDNYKEVQKYLDLKN